jgi:hypothetical protein
MFVFPCEESYTLIGSQSSRVDVVFLECLGGTKQRNPMISFPSNGLQERFFCRSERHSIGRLVRPNLSSIVF